MPQLVDVKRQLAREILTLPDRTTPSIFISRWVLAAALPILLTIGLTQVRNVLSLPSQLLCYLGIVVSVAAISGLWPALLAAVAGSLLADYYFIDPIYNISPMNPDNLAFFVVAAIVGALIARAGRPRGSPSASVVDVTAAIDETFQQVTGAAAWSAVYVDPEDGEPYAIWAPDQDCQETAQQFADGIHGLVNQKVA